MFHNTMQDYRHERGYRAGRGGWVVKFSHIKKFKLTRGCCSPLTTLPVLPPQWQVSFNLLPNNPMAPPQCEGSFGPSAAPGHQWFPHNDSLWTEPSQLFRFHALCSWSIPMVSSKVTYRWHLSGPFWVTTCFEEKKILYKRCCSFRVKCLEFTFFSSKAAKSFEILKSC